MFRGAERPWRAPPSQVWPLLLFSVTALFLSGCSAQTFIGCLEDNAVQPSFVVSAINVETTLTVEECLFMCKMEGYMYAGITEGTTCQCSNDDVNVPFLATSVLACDVTCVDSEECGGAGASALSVYETGGGPLNFTMDVLHTLDTDLTITLTPEVLTEEMYLIDIGTGTATLELTATNSPLVTECYIIPGTYTVSVMGMVEGVSSVFLMSDTVQVPGISSVEAVTCPLVWEPDEVFLCNATVTLGEAEHVFTANFESADQTVNSDFAGVGSFLQRIGEPVPMGYSPSMVSALGNTMTTVITFSEFTIARPSMLHAVEIYAMEAGDYNWEVERPTCAAGSYCVFTGGCLDPCPFDSANNAYTCAAPDLFCFSRGTCGNYAQVCAAAGSAPTWASVTSGLLSPMGPSGVRDTLATPLPLFPGDTLVVTGNLALSPDEYVPGDTVHGTATNMHHVANMVVKELVPVQLSHTCLVVHNDVTLTVEDNTATTVQSNITACQRNITDILIDVLDVTTDAWNPTLNSADPYYCWAGAAYSHFFRAHFTIAGPMDITVTFDPDWGFNATLTDIADYPDVGTPHTVQVPFSIPTEGDYTAEITAENLHNTYYTAPTHSITVKAQYPVLPNWVMAPQAASGAYLVPPTMPTFTFTDTLAGDFPTDAFVLVDWKDGSEPTVYDFDDPGTNVPIFTHNYTVDGVYDPEVFIYNDVSGYNTTCTVTIIEEILNLNIVNGYFQSPTSPDAKGGFGKIKNQYPMDKNLTFFPQMSQGTVDYYEVRHTINNSLIFSFTTADNFDPLVDPFSYHFDFETFLNITVTATNQFHTATVDLFLEIVGQVRVLQIDDFSIVSKPDEVKWFEFTFETIGGGTCLIIDWGKDGPLEAIGEELSCKTNFSHAIYHPDIELEMAMNLSQIYPTSTDPAVKHMVYNVSGFAYNQMGTTEFVLLFPITDLECTPPTVTIADQVLNYQSAPTKYRGEDNTIEAMGTINCNVTQKTKKRWQILHVDEATGQITSAVIVMDLISSWNKTALVIPARFLSYGLYVAVYTLTMWDPPVLDTSVTFQRQAKTYFEIIKTPLLGKMTETSVSRVKRGPNQVLTMEPAIHSEDPDFPDVKNFTVEWHCRELAETLPTAGVPSPIAPISPGGTGCFGYGPGSLNITDRELYLTGSEFLQVGIYEFVAKIGKDTRTADAIIQVEVVAEDVMLIDVECITAALCQPAADGTSVYANPSSRLAVTSECLEGCTSPDTLTTVWSAIDQDGNEIPISGDGSELVLEADSFFAANPGLLSFTLTADVTDEFGVKGSTSYFFKVNQPPIAPYHDPAIAPVPSTGPNDQCQVEPAIGRALLDTFTLTCNFWTDPENIGVKDYSVQLVYKETPEPPPVVIAGKLHSNTGDQKMELVFPAATFDVEVVVTDLWDAFTVHKAAADFTALMISEEELNAADIDGTVSNLAGAGNTAMLTMVIAAQSSVSGQASWLDLTDPNLSDEELKARQLLIAEQNLNALQSIKENTNFESLSGLNAASGAVAQIMSAASKSPEASLTIGLDSRDMVLDILDGYDEILSSSGCSVIPELDFAKADFLAYDTDIGFDYEMVIPATVSEAKSCNVKDTTKNGATDAINRANGVVESMGLRIMDLMVVGDSKTIESGNGMTMCLEMHKGNLLPGNWWCGNSFFDFPSQFCPQGRGCRPAVSSMAKEWPATTYQATGSASKLARGSKVLDVDLFERDGTKLDVHDVTTPLHIGLPRTMNKRENNTMPDFEMINATFETANQLIPVMYSTFFVNETQNSATIEIIPGGSTSHLFIVLSKGVMPTLRNHSLYKLVKNMPFVNATDIMEWFLPSRELGGQGQYFVGVGQFSANVTNDIMTNPGNTTANDVQVMTQDYQLRVYTSGCYFRNVTSGEWVNDGLHVMHANHTRTLCETNHLTSFGPGFVVVPNSIDFSYVFANMGFIDNLTIYITIMICIAIFIILLIWARWQDGIDEKLVGAAPLPDNRPEDKYIYEIIVCTGNKMEAQTDSLVQFTLTGDHGESDVRTFGDSERKIFQKSDTDAFVMATDRPLGNLHFMRIWHDNSGKGPNASWFLAYVIFRDVQTGERFEFIYNDWLGLEKSGRIETLIPTAADEDKKSFKHLFTNVSNKSIMDNHLWFSIFLRPHRSRFTRCQRVASCFALLFQSMLANAMFYETVPETPMSGGLNIGPFNMTPEQMGVGFLCDLIVFPTSFLIVFLFRHSRPKHLRESRIDKAFRTTVKQLNAKKVGADGNIIEEDSDSDEDDDEEEYEEPTTEIDETDTNKVKPKRRFALPWWCAMIAWGLVAVSVVASLFFLLMYGIMFGQNRATKWITSLVISLFSSILVVQPFKIFLIAAFFSVICKKSNLDEDENEDDEEMPDLDTHQQWMYDGLGDRPKLYRKEVDPALLQRIKEKRINENKMHEIMKELLVYVIFIYILMTLSANQRDTSAFLLKENLRKTFIHEKERSVPDFTKATDTSQFWVYLQRGLFPFLRADWHYNGRAPYQLRGFLNDQTNRIMGYATVRQIRAKKNMCHVPKDMQYLSLECSAFSQVVNEESKNFCSDWRVPLNTTSHLPQCQYGEFKYSTAASLKTLPLWGQIDWYGGGGYVIHLRGSTTTLLKHLDDLQHRRWVDRMTRAVLVEFSTYNAGTNLFGVATLMFEFTPGGGIIPFSSFEAVRLIENQGQFILFTYIMQGAFVLFTLYFTVKEAVLFYRQRSKYFDSYWSYAEIGIIVSSYTAMVLYALRYIETAAALAIFNETWGNGYIRLTYAVAINEYYGYVLSMMVFVCLLKFIKMLRFYKRIGLLSATLRKCWDDLTGFLMAFFLCFFSFVFLFYILLGGLLVDFFDFVGAVETSFGMLLGKFSFDEMKDANPVAPVLFFVYVLFNSWVLINLLLTVVIRAFEEVKLDLMNQPNDYEIVNFVWSNFKTAMGKGDLDPCGPVQTTTTDKTKQGSEATGEKVDQLPDKMDKFLEFVNDTYFEGTLDLRNKRQLKWATKNADKPYSRGTYDQKPKQGPWIGGE